MGLRLEEMEMRWIGDEIDIIEKWDTYEVKVRLR